MADSLSRPDTVEGRPGDVPSRHTGALSRPVLFPRDEQRRSFSSLVLPSSSSGSSAARHVRRTAGRQCGGGAALDPASGQTVRAAGAHARLGEAAGASFSLAFFSPSAANALLAESHARGKQAAENLYSPICSTAFPPIWCTFPPCFSCSGLCWDRLRSYTRG